MTEEVPMSDTERVRAWRQRLKDGGLVPMTIWVKAETKARYEDLALQNHRSGSELAQLALDAYRLDPAMASVPVTETETATPQEPRWLTTVEAFVSDMATDTDTDIAGSALPQEPLAPSGSDTETDAVTETTAPTGADPEATTETS